jgi:molybdenum cofactor cytidylyltransferase
VSRLTRARSIEARPDAERTAGPCGLILAAGQGVRFGEEPKLLAELEGRPLLEHAVRSQCAVPGLERVVVVLGAHAAGIMAGVDFLCSEPVICEDWREGMAASLRRGVEELDGAERVIVTLGDQPLVTAEVIERFLKAPPGTRATYDGRPGHPVVLGPEQLRAIPSLHGDSGARELLGGAPAIECGTLCCGRDIDTPDDLEAIRDEARASP